MTAFYTRARRALMAERGDADPILTIVGMLVAALISATMIGIITIVIQSGANIVTENLRATTIGTAQKAWAQDANNASLVVQTDDELVAFYEIPGRAPGVYMKRGDGTGGDYCRKSIWSVTDDGIRNVVQQFDNAMCDLEDSTLQPDRQTTLLTLDGVEGAASIVAENAAGRDLHFEEGVEIGLAETSPQPSTNTRASWWRDYEWAYTQPRKINLEADIDLPLSGVSDSTLRGSTWIVTSNDGDRIDTPEAEPEVVEYTPGALSGLTVTRSSTVGDVYAFVREGINVSFNGADCGPYSVEYTVTWQPSTPGAVQRQSRFTAFGQPAPVDLDRVPNGAQGVVTVTAACPTSVSSDVASISESYTQPLPAPTLSGQIGAQPHLHNISWTAVSSLPVAYRSEVNVGAGFVVQDRALPNPTEGTSHALTWDQGSTYGVPHNYRVIATLGTVEGNPSNTVELFSPWPALSTPIVDGVPNGPLHDITTEPFTCPAGTTAQYRHRVEINEGGPQGWSAWSTTRTRQYTLEEGRLAQFEGEVRCYYDADQFSDPSDPGQYEYVQPIITAPNPPDVTFVNPPGQDNPVRVDYIAVGCPAGTNAEYRVRYAINAGAMGAWSAWSATPSTTVQVYYGGRLVVDVEARCFTPYTQGPPSLPTPDSYVRPIPAPATPQNIRNDAGGTSQPKNDRVLYDAVTCWTGTTPQYRRVHDNVAAETTYTTALTRNVGTQWGTFYSFRVLARCVSPYAVSPDSAWSTPTQWTTNVPQATTPAVSVPASAYTGDWFGVTASGGGCPAGTSTNWDAYTSGGSQRWSTNSFSDYWSTTGVRTYYVRAQCQGPNAAGAWSGYGSDSISIIARPVPSAPGGVSALWNSAPSGGGGGVRGSWTAVSGATSYTYGASHNLGGNWTAFTSASVASAGAYTVLNCGGVANMIAGEFRVRATNGAGSSSTVTVGATRNTSLSTCA